MPQYHMQPGFPPPFLFSVGARGEPGNKASSYHRYQLIGAFVCSKKLCSLLSICVFSGILATTDLDIPVSYKKGNN